MTNQDIAPELNEKKEVRPSSILWCENIHKLLEVALDMGIRGSVHEPAFILKMRNRLLPVFCCFDATEVSFKGEEPHRCFVNCNDPYIPINLSRVKAWCFYE